MILFIDGTHIGKHDLKLHKGLAYDSIHMGGGDNININRQVNFCNLTLWFIPFIGEPT